MPKHTSRQAKQASLECVWAKCESHKLYQNKPIHFSPLFSQAVYFSARRHATLLHIMCVKYMCSCWLTENKAVKQKKMCAHALPPLATSKKLLRKKGEKCSRGFETLICGLQYLAGWELSVLLGKNRWQFNFNRKSSLMECFSFFSHFDFL